MAHLLQAIICLDTTHRFIIAEKETFDMVAFLTDNPYLTWKPFIHGAPPSLKDPEKTHPSP